VILTIEVYRLNYKFIMNINNRLKKLQTLPIEKNVIPYFALAANSK
jgi:hypothetical protein